ncbi:MAG: methyltransferase domain-containing protein [Chloroflexi bacterium]|nr:MAG: methyltransferase domain-containing protein [Chloroflexota bacterium]
MSSKPKDRWASGEDYERYVGRWSRLVAREFLKWLAIPAGSQWLDVGCGTGALSQTILQFAEPAKVEGIDRSEGFVALARVNTQDDRVQFEVGDAESLTADSGTFDTAASGLVLNFIPQPDRAVAEMRRVTRSGGVVAAYLWDYVGRMQMMRHFWDTAIALDPSAYELDQGRRFPICQPDALSRLFESAGLHHVEVRPMEVPTVFRDFDDYWSPFLAGQGPAPSYLMSLSDERRVALRERIRAGLPFAPDGSIPLVARAWAVRGLH